MKKKNILLIALFLIFASCKTELEERYCQKIQEIELKTKELEYLEKVYRLKEDIKYEERLRVMDSIINQYLTKQ